jgi:phosphoenolpyruvate carboxykinase (ATP)
MGKKVKPVHTLKAIEDVVEGKAKFKKWGNFSDIEICEVEGFVPNLNDKEYVKMMIDRLQDRINFVEKCKTEKGGYDAIPEEALEVLKKALAEAKK